MATIANNQQQDEEQQQGQGQQQPEPTQPISVTGASGAITGAPSGTPTSAPSQGSSSAPEPSKAGSGRFLNIRKYIDANKGTDSASRIGNSVENQRNQLQQNLQSNRQQIEGQANPEIQRLQTATQGGIQNTLSNVEQAAQDQSQLAEFNRLRQGQYLQNLGIQNESQLNSQQQKLAQQAQMAGTEQGRFQLLRDTLGNNNYNRGQNRLDQLLLQGQTGQLRQLGQQTGQAAQAAGSDLEALRNTVSGYNQQLGTLGSQAQQMAESGISGLAGETTSQLEARRAAEQQARQQAYQAASQGLQGLASGQGINRDVASQLGLQEGQRLWGLSNEQLQQYLNPNVANQEVQLRNIAQQSDVDRLKALAALSGKQELGQLTDVGPRLGDSVQFNGEQFLSDLAARQAAYNQEASNPYNQGIIFGGNASDLENQIRNYVINNKTGGNAVGKYSPQQKIDAGNAALAQLNALRQRYGLSTFNKNWSSAGLTEDDPTQVVKYV